MEQKIILATHESNETKVITNYGLAKLSVSKGTRIRTLRPHNCKAQ